MGQLHRVMLAAALCVSCSGRRTSDRIDDTVRAREAGLAQVEGLAAPDERLDREGKLLPSQRHMSWLELPSGFATQPGSNAKVGVYEAEGISLEAVRVYLVARVVPAEIESRSNGFVYRRALPSYSRLPVPPLDVTVLEVEHDRPRVRLVIDDLSPPAEPPLPVDIAAKELDRARKRAQ